MTDWAERYDRSGKRKFTRLLLDLLVHDGCRTFGTFWGAGGEARLAVGAGLSVLAVDNDPTTHEPMAEDARRVGYECIAGNARSLRRHFDSFHTDFMGTPSPDNFQTVRAISKITDKWLAVTVSTDHIFNPEMQGPAIVATLPAWLTYAAEGFTLEYLSTYTRNERGLRMWVALLRRRVGHGNSHRVQPLQISWSLKQRGYWASAAMYRDFGQLLSRRTGIASDARTEYLKTRYWANRDRLLQKSRDFYHAHAAEINAKQRARLSEPEVRAKANAYQREWRKSHPRTPEQEARRAAYRKQYYLDHREDSIAKTAAWRKARRAEAG